MFQNKSLPFSLLFSIVNSCNRPREKKGYPPQNLGFNVSRYVYIAKIRKDIFIYEILYRKETEKKS